MRKIAIEDLLIWAFTVELPKVGAMQASLSGPGYSHDSSLATLSEYGSMFDRDPNAFGVIPNFIFDGFPHRDAIQVGEAVKGLASRDGYEIASGWKPFPEWQDEHGLISQEVARIVAAETGRGGLLGGKQIVELVTTSAIMKHGPDWRVDEPKIVMVMRSGKPAWFIKRSRVARKTGRMEEFEDDGFDAKKQRPKPGAYRKYRIDESIRGAVLARMEWQLWHSALEALAIDLSGRLFDHEIAPFQPNRSPWLASQRRIETLNRV